MEIEMEYDPDDLLGSRNSNRSRHQKRPILLQTNSYLNVEKDKYLKMEPEKDIRGFVVNTHDSLNYDIDLDLTLFQHEKYHQVISNQYTYRNLGNLLLPVDQIEELPVKIGTSYRCRLKGITIDLHNRKDENKFLISLTNEVKNLIDKAEGFVVCQLCDIDVYRRLLIELSLTINGNKIDIGKYLLERCKELKNDIISPYIKNRRY